MTMRMRDKERRMQIERLSERKSVFATTHAVTQHAKATRERQRIGSWTLEKTWTEADGDVLQETERQQT